MGWVVPLHLLVVWVHAVGLIAPIFLYLPYGHQIGAFPLFNQKKIQAQALDLCCE